jgi:hypothetical protein
MAANQRKKVEQQEQNLENDRAFDRKLRKERAELKEEAIRGHAAITEESYDDLALEMVPEEVAMKQRQGRREESEATPTQDLGTTMEGEERDVLYQQGVVEQDVGGAASQQFALSPAKHNVSERLQSLRRHMEEEHLRLKKMLVRQEEDSWLDYYGERGYRDEEEAYLPLNNYYASEPQGGFGANFQQPTSLGPGREVAAVDIENAPKAGDVPWDEEEGAIPAGYELYQDKEAEGLEVIRADGFDGGSGAMTGQEEEDLLRRFLS